MKVKVASSKEEKKIPRNTFAMKLKVLVQADGFTEHYVNVVCEFDREHEYDLCALHVTLYTFDLTIYSYSITKSL